MHKKARQLALTLFWFIVDNAFFCLMPRKKQSARVSDVDFVYLWVDGNDPAHLRKRSQFLKEISATEILEQNAQMGYRWENHDEIIHSLRSVARFCPWVRKIWIITDSQRFDTSVLPTAITEKISFVDHADIFQGIPDALPTFNSRSIETLVWRIDELAEHFVYFNDDMFVLRPTEIRHFFRGSLPIMRGSIRRVFRDQSVSLHQQGMINSRSMLSGRPEKTFFRTAHVPYPLVKSRLQKLYRDHEEAFKENATHRFRRREQFKVVSLLYEYLIATRQYAPLCYKDYTHISGEGCREFTRRKLLRMLGNRKSRFLCINDVGSLARTVPEYRDYLQ